MKNRIVDETIHLIHKKGISFTISDLASRLSVSRRTIYEHFSSKDEIVEEVINRFINQIQAKEQEIACHTQLNPLEKIKLILTYVPEDFQLMDPQLISNIKKSHYNQWVKLDRFIKEEWSEVLFLLEKGIEEGKIKRVNPELFIQMYLSGINKIFDSKFILENQLSIQSALNEMIDILLNGISMKGEEK
ncbi:TetR/AcrR family transcriptional regulator [Bacillus gobiensis]|uniref:TetR/AcrR family transcriptional regulator n=1 Tax=Bacillus gobiensis TaxID=1441095 RepID=UPI003D192183